MINNLKNQNIIGKHMPIMLQESLNLLNIQSNHIVADLTINRSGHARAFFRVLDSRGLLLGNDLDSKALSESKEILTVIKGEKEHSADFIFINDNFKNFKENFFKLKEQDVLNKDLLIDRVFIDLGLSSQEIDISDRGFSFMRDEPLYMTFKDIKDLTEEDITAKHIVNYWSQDLLSDIIYNFSDEKYANSIAKAIVETRKELKQQGKYIETTRELVDIISKAVPSFYKNKRLHFATKTFQALRMAVNDEIGAIIKIIEELPYILNNEARILFLTFHSTEDRIVKKYCKNNPNLIPINKKVIEPSLEEIKTNPRARSCKLRCYEYRLDNKN